MIKFAVYCRFFLLFGLLISFSACEKEDNEVNDKTTNKWIESTMRNYYYWYADIPESGKLNFNSSPETFFTSLLSKNDGKDNPQVSGGHYYYSTIKKKETTSTRSYLGEKPALGFEFQNWQLDKDGTKFAVNVLYVLPGSPAAQGGIKRGDWIHKIDGAAVNGTNIYDLLGSKSVTLEVSDSYSNLSTHAVKLTPAMVEDNPVFLTKVFADESTNGKKVGYLVYNHFTSGPGGDEDKTFDNFLYQAFIGFKAVGVDEFILDLRYNGGGLVTSAQLLSELLAPASALGETFCDLKYNDKQNKTVNYRLEKSDANLNLPRLFVLTSNRTASASEAVINGLKPYYEVVVLGEQTEGKNVGSITLSSDKYGYELHPIVCRLYNSKGESEYKNGFVPNWKLADNDRLILGHIELGDKENDKLLNAAFQWMLHGSVSKYKVAGSTGRELIPAYSSLERRSENAVRIPFDDVFDY